MRASASILTSLFFGFGLLTGSGQTLSSLSLWGDLARLDSNRSLDNAGKLKQLYEWEKISETSHLPKDSVYARLLHKIGVYEWYVNKNYNLALAATLAAFTINRSGKPGASPASTVTDLFNVAFFYEHLGLLRKAAGYFDSAVVVASRGPDPDNVITDSRLEKAYIFFSMGDYEKAVAESNQAIIRALEQKDSLRFLMSLNQRSQALFKQGNMAAAQKDVQDAIRLAVLLHNDFQLASALKERGIIMSSSRSFAQAEASYSECVAVRLRTKNDQQISGDYIDFGAFYSDSLKAFRKAAACYRSAIEFAKKVGDSTNMAMASVDLGRSYYYQMEFDKAMSCYAQATRYLKIGDGAALVYTPAAAALAGLGNKPVVQMLLNSQTAALLGIYRQTRETKWLTACLQSAMLDDTLIRDIRHEQVGEQSKLYWRNRTRDFFADALAACYYAHNNRLAFHFMEESRAVLLQDKLNELGANARLPSAEAAKAESLQIHIIELQQQLNTTADSSAQGRVLLQSLLTAKETLERYIRSLESEYPAYYQYKYADADLPLSALQEFLSANRQRFIEYFVFDSLCYALRVDAGDTRLLRISWPGARESLNEFVRLCSDEDALTSKFSEFLTRSNALYKLLLQPFHLPDGRVIVCQDNVVVPFEALSEDPGKPDFLVRRYAFSYMYSARYLMNRQEQVVGKGDFLGIAPISFAAYHNLPDLRLSEDALRQCSAPYRDPKFLLFADANRQNFIRQVCNYTTTTILTHARSDSSEDEPALFLHDSVIHLSELQMLRKPASRLVVLSACQTNVGKNRNGEGIFSLARGFAAAGIPAVAATQWTADEAAIYSISQRFNLYIHAGMNKDEALQKAKLFYMFQDRSGSLLPCFWADMILIGNSEPIRFPARTPDPGIFGWVLLVVGLSLLGIFVTITPAYAKKLLPRRPARVPQQ